MASAPDLVHLVGSLPYGSCEEAFLRVSAALTPYLRRLPDGTGQGSADSVGRAYDIFKRLRQEALIPLHLRYQVVLAHPEAAIGQMIPGDDLTIQFDSGVDDGALESVPPKAELGVHLDGLDVALMNRIGARLQRGLDYFHLPVPKEADASWFAPLAGWRRRKETWLYLGLIHPGDPDGDWPRIEAARETLAAFGIAAPGGLSDCDPAEIEGILDSHRAAAARLATLL